jgi:hypothetical protein
MTPLAHALLIAAALSLAACCPCQRRQSKPKPFACPANCKSLAPYYPDACLCVDNL